VRVDYELHGCPVSKEQLVEVVKAFAAGRRPVLPSHPVCMECKRRGLTCVLVAGGSPCLGPVTRTGCGALCPTWGRGCFGCFGPVRGANSTGLAAVFQRCGLDDAAVVRAFRGIYAGAESFRKASEIHEETVR
jgi:coenzyme F420-reducing hydrogenase gamma subunit